MREIPLQNTSLTTQVDEEDYRRFAGFRWYMSENGYAIADTYRKKPADLPAKLRLHRLILLPEDGMDVDHINHDRLDNQRSNLRVCTRSQNLGNNDCIGVAIYKGPTSVTWRARISVDNKTVHLGSFSTSEEATRAFKEAAIRYRGEFTPHFKEELK